MLPSSGGECQKKNAQFPQEAATFMLIIESSKGKGQEREPKKSGQH